MQTKTRQLLVAYLIFIKEELEQRPSVVDLDVLRECAVVMTNRGAREPRTHSVYFTPAYGNQIDLANDLPGLEGSPLLFTMF